MGRGGQMGNAAADRDEFGYVRSPVGVRANSNNVGELSAAKDYREPSRENGEGGCHAVGGPTAEAAGLG